MAKSLNLAREIESLSKLGGNFKFSISPVGSNNLRLSNLGGNLQLLMLLDGSHNVRELKWVKAIKFSRLAPFTEYNERSSVGMFDENDPENPKFETLGPIMETFPSIFVAFSSIYEKVSKFRSRVLLVARSNRLVPLCFLEPTP